MTIPREFSDALAGHYRIDCELGHGGMATVYLADDLKHGRKVAIKVMLPEIAASIGSDRFLREIEIAARLTHPHILPLFDSGTAGNQLYYVTPFIEGESLRARLLREKQLPVEDALRLAREILSALGYAHHQGLVHRDIKPENILLADGIALVADFGIARVVSTGAAAETADTLPGTLTDAGVVVGTPLYMAPEQAGGDATDGRADLYSLACVLYEMLAGRPPFTSPTNLGLIRRHLTEEARPVSEFRSAVPADVVAVIAKALAKLPADRPATAARFAESLIVGVAAGATPAPVRERPVTVTPNNLPGQRNQFIGREKELAEGASILEEARLLTLTGIGGCGKTRLAIRLAGDLLPAFPDGVWFMDLAPLKDPAHVALTAATVLGVPDTAGTTLLNALSDRIAGERTLIVLDNCEHLLTATAELVDHLLSSSDGLKVIVTSREGLGVPGERPFALRSLSVPPAATTDIRAIESAEAVRLFVDRARVVDAGFALTEKTAPVVAEICRRLDGIPLAIELAAARVKILSPEQIRLKLDDRFRLLTGGNKSALPRHQTLQATIQWSYDQLSAEEQSLFRLLSVFAGGGSLDLVTKIAGADEFEVMDLLARLVDKSLVLVERTPDTDARYHMLETVRQFAQERLIDAGEAEAARRRHHDEFLALAEQAYGGRNREETRWARTLETEHDNLRAALEVARIAGPEAHLQMSGALAWFWHVRSHFIEGRGHLTEALAAAPPEEIPRPARARALWGVANTMTWQGDGAGALPLMEETLRMWRELGDAQEVAMALEGVGWAQLIAGDDATAGATFRELLKLQGDLGDPVLINRARVALTQVLVALEDLDEARALSKEILAFSGPRGDVRNEHFGLHFLSDCDLIEARCAESLEGYKESLRMVWAIGDRLEASFEVQGVAMSLAGLGQSEEALRLAAAVQAEVERIGADVHMKFWDRLLERYLGPAREALGGAAADKAWSEGLSLGFEEAVGRAGAAQP